jgi:hypothetical protein
MTTKTTQGPQDTGQRGRSPGHLSGRDSRAELGMGRSTIYGRRAATAPDPFVQMGGDR